MQIQIRYFIKLLCVVVSFFVASASNAQSTATGTQYWAKACIGTAEFSPAHASAQNACNQTAAQCMGYTSGGTSYSGTVTGLSCTIKIFNSSGAQIPAGDQTYTIRTSQGPISLGCPPAGESRFVNFTLGFTDDPQLSKSATVNTYADKFQALLSGGSTCASGGGSTCAVSLVNDTGSLGNAWISAAPTSQGLYRISQDYKVTYTGATCSQTADQKMLTESTDTAPACSGVFGTVNGKGVCVPSGTANRNVVAPVGNSPRLVGNPAAGSNAGLPISSRSPSAGTGANDGGPVSPLDGSPAPLGAPLPTTPVSKSTVDVQIDTCGVPGKPACKIDETGTPPDPQLNPTTKTTDIFKPISDFVANPRAALPTLPTINWAFQLPTGCTAIALPAFSPWLQEIDVCQFQPMFHEVMNIVWVMGAIFGMIGTFWRNVFSQG